MLPGVQARGVPVHRLVHREGSFVITFPNAYHAGFNTGAAPLTRSCSKACQACRQSCIVCRGQDASGVLAPRVWLLPSYSCRRSYLCNWVMLPVIQGEGP